MSFVWADLCAKHKAARDIYTKAHKTLQDYRDAHPGLEISPELDKLVTAFVDAEIELSRHQLARHQYEVANKLCD